jgi:hypothetical protein
MKQNNLVKCVLAALTLVTALLPAAGTAQSQTKPNILVLWGMTSLLER